MKQLSLREFADGDIPLLKKWLYLPHVAAWYQDPLDWLKEVERRNEFFSFLHHFMVETDNHPIGFCQFYEYKRSGESWYANTDIEGVYSIDYLIGDTNCLGKGFGRAIIRALVEKIKMQDNARLIIVQPEQENRASCHTLLSYGFSFDKDNKTFILEL